MRAALVLIIISALSACSGARGARYLEDVRTAARAELNAEECAREGGRIEGIGILGIPACVRYYSDGGVVCAGKSDCEGLCLSLEIHEEGKRMSGVCQSSEHDLFGCFSRIEGGLVSGVLCQD